MNQKQSLNKAGPTPVPTGLNATGNGQNNITIAGAAVPPLSSVTSLCTFFGISRSTLWRWIGDRGFPKPICVGGKSRFFRSVEVNAWLEAQAGSHHAK